MGAIISNGSRTNIEKSITHNLLGELLYHPSIVELMNKHPFTNNELIISKCKGEPTCWGFQDSTPRWRKLFNSIMVGDSLLLFENKNDNNFEVSSPEPRVFGAKVVHKEPNLAFGDALWNEKSKWHYIYFLTDVKPRKHGKFDFCEILKLNNQFPQHRKETVPELPL